MAQIKRLINFVVPVTSCNFKCHYCYIGQENKFEGTLGTLDYPPEHIQKALSKERLGGVCHINMCGLGETLLAPYVVDLAKRMLENGHIVSIVTNGVVQKRIEELCQLPEALRERLFFKISFHYLELVRQGILDRFFENIQRIKEAGCSFTVELTVNDETVEMIPDIQAWCQKNLGALCHVIESRNNLDGFSRLTQLSTDEHQKAWKTFDSPLFDFQQQHWMVKRKEFCYAGDWVVSLNAGSGWMMPCFAGGNALQNIYEDLDEPIHFKAIGTHCPWTHCYAAYVLLTSGTIPELDTPSYCDCRNRTCNDGSSWLQPSMQAWFSGKFQEATSPYSEEKKLWLDILSAREYGIEKEINPQQLEQVGKALEDAMAKKGLHSVAICAKPNDVTADWLIPVFSKTTIKVVYVLDMDYAEDTAELSAKARWMHRFKYIAKKLLGQATPWLNRYDVLPPVDAAIVLDVPQISSVKAQIRDCHFKNIVPISELTD